ncbi:MAG TPA: DEAD/DEAH box helicase, partial [Candidatus Competibacteraceae bacterium]|nr:DEAD/DEAH box helicase [Candidatus Competibacteraceae bacterium]
MSSPDNETLRQSLIAAYEDCSPVEQAVLQLLSIIYDGVGKTALADYIRDCGMAIFKTKRFLPAGLTQAITRLTARELVIRKGDYNQLYCHFLLLEEVTRRAIREGHFESMANAVQKRRGTAQWDRFYLTGYNQLLSELRIAFHRGNLPRVQAILDACESQYSHKVAEHSPWLLIFNNPLYPEELWMFPDERVSQALTTLFTAAARNFRPADQTIALAERLLAANRCADVTRYYLAEQALLRNDPAKARGYLAAGDSDYDQALRGWLAFLDGADEEAIQHYENALKLLRKRTGKRKIYFNHLAGMFFILALLARNTPAHLRQALETTAPLFDKGAVYPYLTAYQVLREVVEVQQGQRQRLQPLDASVNIPPADGFFQVMALFWMHASAAKPLRKPIATLLDTARQSHYDWFVGELTGLLHILDGNNDETGHRQRPLTRLFALREPWEHALSALLELSQRGQEPPAAPTQLRLVWWIDWHQSGICAISPREQKRDARGQWTQGRAVALKRLVQQARNLDYLTQQDREVCACIQPFSDGYYGSVSYEIDMDRALPLLVGHPLVFWADSPAVRVELVRGEPELLVTPKGSQWRLELSPRAEAGEALRVVKETPTRLKVVTFNQAHQSVMTIIGKGLLVPARAKDRVLETVAALSGIVTVQSSLDSGVENLPEVAASPALHVHLLPFGEGLKIALLVRPFGAGPYYAPGAGGERVIAEVDGQRVQARRDLQEERRQAAEVVKACPTLALQGADEGEWRLEDAESCLEALLELQALGDQVTLAWPEGEAFKVSRPASSSQLRLNVKRRQDWFDLSGELRLPDNQVLNMRQLLELLDHSPGRFVPLGQGQFLALTQEFRKRLDEVRGFAELTAQGARFHPLAALLLEPLLDEAGSVRADAAWKVQIQRLREVEALQSTVPFTLQGELRDYQVDGFQWLARLAHWGVGACLADDMGLGKTVQALAAILAARG